MVTAPAPIDWRLEAHRLQTEMSAMHRLLAALVAKNGGEVRVSNEALEAVPEYPILSSYVDAGTRELVVTYRAG